MPKHSSTPPYFSSMHRDEQRFRATIPKPVAMDINKEWIVKFDGPKMIWVPLENNEET